MKTCAGIGALACLFVASTGCAQEADPRVTAIIESTRNTVATYALYSWSRMTPPDGKAVEEWAAEFHSGNRHRVETPRDRIVADCSTGEGTHFNVVIGQTQTAPWIAQAACGINANKVIEDSRIIGSGDGRFGPTMRIEVIDADAVRTYDVRADGVLVAATISDKPPTSTARLTSAAVLVAEELPTDDIFSVGSLNNSVVPAKFKQAPTSN